VELYTGTSKTITPKLWSAQLFQKVWRSSAPSAFTAYLRGGLTKSLMLLSHLVHWFDPRVCLVLIWTCVTAEYWTTAHQKQQTDLHQDILAPCLGRQLGTNSADDPRADPHIPWVPQFQNEVKRLEKLHFSSLTLKDTGITVSQTPHRSLDPSTCCLSPGTATQSGPELPLGSASRHVPQENAFCPCKAVPRELCQNPRKLLTEATSLHNQALSEWEYIFQSGNIISELGLLFPLF